ncbi:site-specific integrase [Paenirhodobacter populi]|uniref:site-specific integrase n=1 Tax=Paenirhodobacter populi TaxID=2306993 RepID=UPI000FE2B0FB|nr:site-specific integrase [Sinirhodobacter populi]RWR05100.1 site-specific integrase [Sinirhodobacter populi]
MSAVRGAISAAVKRERAVIDFEAAGGDPAAIPGVSAFFFFFGNDAAPDDVPEPPKKPKPKAEVPAPETLSRDDVTPPPRKKRQQPESGFSARIRDVVERLSKTHARTGRANAKTLTQMRAVVDLFCEITGVDDVRDVRQQHLALFISTLDSLPPTYRRSEAEREKPITDIIADAEASGVPIGLSVATVNRNLVHIGKVLKAAQAEGLRVDSSLNPSLLRRFSKRAAKDEREAFTPDDVKRIFEAPVWTGSKTAKRRRDPGTVVVKDWLYWIPLIAAYSGARREEICGLETADVSEVDGVAVLLIRPNARRGLKNPQSERTVPIHSHVLELGFLDFVEAQRTAGHKDLFHDLKRKSANSQIGDSMDYLWRHIQADRLGAQPKKTFHSFRHYAVQGLRSESDVEKHVRAELFGHLVGDIEDDRYGGRAPIAALRAAVEALPRVF